MLIHAIVPVSRANGPGERFVLWVQGCRRGCRGCFNPAAHAREPAVTQKWKKPPRAAPPQKSVNEIIFPAWMSAGEIISYIPRGRVSGITVSGGEPFEQPEELGRLLAAARLMGLHTLVYSGYTYEELRRAGKTLLRKIDILIDGPYMREVPQTEAWAGSGNQRVLSLRNGEIIVRDSSLQERAALAEIHIDKKGCLTATGGFRIL
jgi:anaerobic ribonucleoside-triphosphate reductase activating protein